ncbi:hypothetical protein [Actinoplanes regularis]|uniref:hypothetical protein n=1 Tax=Actinoplanes regularis TaxID=52697 RepID=UPI002556CAE5|nr:hypothetical protein [Actinoplanes regularis]
MEPVMLDGTFRLWSYGVGHSQLVLHARVADGDQDAVSVHFEGVRAVKLRASYPGLVIQPADPPTRTRLLDYAGVPDFLRQTELCLTLPTEEDGFVVCGRARVLAGRHSNDQGGWRLPDPAEVLQVWQATKAGRAAG